MLGSKWPENGYATSQAFSDPSAPSSRKLASSAVPLIHQQQR
jgi:hypothetical protein